MGWKGTMRSMQAASNKAEKESEKRRREQERIRKKFAKKEKLLSERRSRPMEKLKSKYASGKIDKEEYEKLAERDKDVTLDLILFGRTPAVKLAIRYVTGRVDKEEYERLLNELIGEPKVERDNIETLFQQAIDKLDEVVSKARKSQADDKCAYCSREKKWYSPLIKEADFRLCVPCKYKFSKLKKFSRHEGNYYIADAVKLKIDAENNLEVSPKPEHVLNYK